jgi:phosphoribosylaminoimidazole carboxylase PurE protein
MFQPMEDQVPSLVAIVCGSKSDLPVIEEATRLLERFGVPHDVTVASAHRQPARVERFCARVRDEGIRVVIAAAGHAAHLAGVVAAQVPGTPVLGVPIASSDLNGLDSLLAMVQMPGGVPVAVMALGRAGARNSAVFSAQVLAPSHPEIGEALAVYRAELAEA